MDKGMEVEYSDHPFYYQIGKLPVKFIKPETIKEKELRTVDDVLEHLKDLPEAKSAMSYQREAVFEGRIRQIGDKISEFETSEGKPFRLYMKYFGEPSSNSSKGFFEERNIDFSMIITRAELTSCLESIMEKDYEVDLSYLKHANRVSSKKQENSKGKVIFTILSLAIDPCKEEPLIIDDDYTITPDSSHVVKPDHVFINTSTGIPLLITEDKDKDLMHGVLQNFDQLKSFSMTEAGAEMKIFSGLATDLENWIFTCYVRPEETKPVSIHNFHVSSVFVISHGTLNQIDDEAVKRLIRTIRGYIVRMEEATKIIGAK